MKIHENRSSIISAIAKQKKQKRQKLNLKDKDNQDGKQYLKDENNQNGKQHDDHNDNMVFDFIFFFGFGRMNKCGRNTEKGIEKAETKSERQG